MYTFLKKCSKILKNDFAHGKMYGVRKGDEYVLF